MNFWLNKNSLLIALGEVKVYATVKAYYK